MVIPTYNRARDLERALDSVVAQSCRDLEVLVVDNHSTDDTAAVVERYNDSRIALHFVTNEGIVARSRNLGIRRARGEFVAFLDSDDWWTPRKLEASVAVLDAGADVVYHHLFLVTRPHQNVLWRRVWARDISSPVFDDLLLNGTALPQSSVVMRRDLLLSVGGMPEERDVVAMEDYLCWLKAARMTERFRACAARSGTTGRVAEISVAQPGRFACSTASRQSLPKSWRQAGFGKHRAGYRTQEGARISKRTTERTRAIICDWRVAVARQCVRC